MRRNYATRQCMNTYYGKTLHAQLETWESDTYQALKSLKREAEISVGIRFLTRIYDARVRIGLQKCLQSCQITLEH